MAKTIKANILISRTRIGTLRFERSEGREARKAYVTIVGKFGEHTGISLTRHEAALLRQELGEVIAELDSQV